MALIYLAVSSTFSASGYTDQGSLDSLSGSTLGATIPCPGVTPCRISLKCTVSGSHTTVVDSVYAGANHVVIQEYQHSQVPSIGNQVRLETINRNVKIAGGIYVEEATLTATPVLKPYYDITGANRGSISLKGLPTALFSGVTTRARVGSNATASDISNYYTVVDPFTIKFSSHYLDDGVNLLWNYAIAGGYTARSISVNLSGSRLSPYFTSSPTALTPQYNIQYLKSPAVVNTVELVDSDVSGYPTNTTLRPAVTFVASELAAPFACFTGTPPTLSASVYGVAVGSTPQIKALAVYDSENAGTETGIYTFASIEAVNNYAAIGMFNNLLPISDPAAEFLESYTASNRRSSGLKPAFGFNPNYVSIHLADATKRNSYWADAYPPPPTISYNEYEDVKSTQYGFIFLNKNTKHLELLFQPHFSPWIVSPTTQVINKLLHAPPRSADYYPALNMQWGMDPAKGTDAIATSLYKGQAEVIGTIVGSPPILTVTSTNFGTISAGMVISGTGIPVGRTILSGTVTNAVTGAGSYTISGAGFTVSTSITITCSLTGQELTDVKGLFAEHINHGGGGHVMAMGTYNGAIVSDGVVTVWGSNRWGQCVFPSVLKGRTVIDVAVSNAPPVLEEASSNPGATVYSDAGGEYASRTYSSIDPTTGANPFKYCYPPSSSFRFGRHINYTNLPGHVVVVDQATGRVYAWGNNKYHQCSVPDEIALVSDSGAIQTGVLTDPITEVSAGAFHTVARSKAGVLFVWGAGGPWVAPDGLFQVAVAINNPSAERPDLTTTPDYAKSVHFTQSIIRVSSGLKDQSFINPSTQIPGTTAINSESFLAGSSSTTATNVTRLISGVTINVGQKSSINLCLADPSTGRLKGIIAAGAFHTAIIDNAYHIQCQGAGKGFVGGATIDVTSGAEIYDDLTTTTSNIVKWGSSYSYESPENQLFSTYPHYCQSLNQYTCPISIVGSSNNQTANLFRYNLATVNDTGHKSRYFQDLQFKKVVCGPFSTHGIIYSVSRITSPGLPAILKDVYTAMDKAYLHNRVVSWGCTHGTRSHPITGTGPTGILGQVYSTSGGGVSSRGYANSATTNNLTDANPAGSLSGMGQIDFGGANVYLPRMFEIINRPLPGIYTSHITLVGAPAVNGANTTSVGSVVGGVGPTYTTACPVTISRFKVKDLAVCGDYAAYISYVDTLNQGSSKVTTQDESNSAVDSGESYDYQASVVFTGNNYYRTMQSSSYGRMHANNPYAGTRLARRNKLTTVFPLDVDSWMGSSSLNIKTKSMYFGNIQSATNIVGRLVSDTVDNKFVSYLIPTTILASSNMVTAVVNMDNRPVAWSGYFNVTNTDNVYAAPIDLSILPSVPLLQFKTGTSHAIGIADGDWPIAKSLSSATTTPKLVSELGAKVFTTTIPTVFVAPTLVYGDATKYKRPVLVAWGAGDGREYGTTLLSFGIGSGGESTYGMHFLDTHAVTRYDATYAVGLSQTLAVTNDDPWENYYGQYRWNVESTYDKIYNSPNIEGAFSTGPGAGSFLGGYGLTAVLAGEGAQSTAGAISRPVGHHAVEAMQSMLNFRQDVYPTTYATPALTGRALLNGNTVAAIPSAVFRPFVDYVALQTGQALNNTVCCATAADEAVSDYSSINSLQEYNSALGYMQQTYTDYVVDYAAGDMHSAVLFSSSCPNYPLIADGTYKSSKANFATYFLADALGSIPFGNRRICKLGIVGYGCENQTAGRERQLSDGMAPIVPMMFSRDAKVYCGDSYTLVTNPIRVVTVESSTVNVVLTGSGTTTQTIPITVPASVYSKRIRGLDVILTFTAVSAATPIPLSSWNIKIPYKNNTWTVLGRVKANLDVGGALAYIAPGTAVTTFRVSDRFSTAKAYTYDTYTEVGSDPTVLSAYTFNTNNYLKGYAASPAIPALSKQGCYYPVTVDPTTNVVTPESWGMTSISGVAHPFNEPTINVVIEDVSGAASYAYTVKATLEIEVDASDVPYVIFGPSKSGVFNEIQGLGPSFAADTQSFLENTGTYPSISLSSCPCEINNSPNTIYSFNTRKFRPAFPADSKFICGTKKYGPLGNRENQASYASETRFNPDNPFSPVRGALIRGNKITANFFSLFDTVPHRALLSMPETLYTKGPILQVLGTNAFVVTAGNIWQLQTFNPALKLNTTARLTVGPSASSSLRLSTISAVMYNKTLFGSASLSSTVTTVNTASTGFRLIVNMYSNCL